MLRLSLIHDQDRYRSPVTWLYCGCVCMVRLTHKPWHKRESKGQGYRDTFYTWLRETDDDGKPVFHDDELCQVLGEALTRQEWRYFKQAYYLAAKHVSMEVGPWATISSSVVANFSRVRSAYEKALQSHRRNSPSRQGW